MLEDFLHSFVTEKEMDEFFFQQDGAPSHTARPVMESLRSKFNGKLISRFGDFELPSISPDITPPDFFLWGCLKYKIYENSSQSLEDLRMNIRLGSSMIRPSVLVTVLESTTKRMQLCLERDGRHLKSVFFEN